ncbi:hypothetical protein DFP72DRAFT_1052606 [Ephemerocybe angulata]|uniref:Uncharacterized protein n=1 Tax=Ephemerocybe angulata TaxID=980116 RepID=A0A8H6HBA7_9AGAR|nr:hypothetical protein DFP72DRAFT_1052606 [Tulosesus angulatus]
MAGPQGRLVLLFSLLFSLVASVLSRRAKGIIEDNDNNSNPGYEISFLPAKNGHWNDESACSPGNAFCLAADPAQCHGSSWTATGLYGTGISRSIIIDFIGDAISMFFTLVESGPSNYSTKCTFTLDGKPAQNGQYVHTPQEDSTVRFAYQVNAFNTESGLKHGAHQLIIAVASSSQTPNYLNFDYAEYSYDDALISEALATSPTVTTTVTATAMSTGANASSQGSVKPGTTSSNDGVFKAAIIGGSISGTLVVIAIVAFVMYRSRLRNQQPPSDRLTFGVPSTYAGSTRKLSIPFWPHKPADDDGASNGRNLTALPEKRASYGSSSQYSEKYEPEFASSPGLDAKQRRDRTSTASRGMLSPANALMQSFYPNSSKRGSNTTGKLSRLDGSLSSPASNYPRHLSTFSDVRAQQTTDTGVTFSSSNVLPLQSPTSTSAGRSYYAV